MEQNYPVRDLDEMLDETARVFKAMGDPIRIRILGMLISGELCACKFHEVLDLPQNLVSHHLKVLHENQVIVGRKEGRNIFYSLDEQHIESIRDLLGDLINGGVRK